MAVLTAAFGMFLGACGDDETSAPWDDLSGTIYFLEGERQDSVFQLDVRSGSISPVEGAVDVGFMDATVDGASLYFSRLSIVKHDNLTGAVSVVVPDEGDPRPSRAVVSPNGRRIAHLLTDSRGFSLIVRDSDGAHPVTVVGPVTEALTPTQARWLDDTTLVFLRADSTSGLARLWNVHSDGSGLGFFGSDTGTIVDAVETARTSRRLMVVRRPTGSLPDELWEMDGEGRLTRLIVSLADGAYPFYAWSPDQRHIALCLATSRSPADLAVVEVSTGQVRSLTSGAGYECSPEWVP